jgi:hypothetical protein
VTLLSSLTVGGLIADFHLVDPRGRYNWNIVLHLHVPHFDQRPQISGIEGLSFNRLAMMSRSAHRSRMALSNPRRASPFLGSVISSPSPHLKSLAAD